MIRQERLEGETFSALLTCEWFDSGVFGGDMFLEQLLAPRHLLAVRTVERDLLVLLVDVIRERAFEREGFVALFALERLGARVEVFVVDKIVAMSEHLGAVATAECLWSENKPNLDQSIPQFSE